ncbi:MAG: hypothetical protein CM15mV19_1210 [uncultured marine virus]|nr:MAG: hypothetical protein CM15mV19_1210 [uncultured marine virus]
MYGTPEYEAAYKEGRFRDVPNPLDEVVLQQVLIMKSILFMINSLHNRKSIFR